MGMDHAAAQDLNPAGAFAEPAALSAALEAGYVHLGAGLREGEMVGTEFYLRLRSEHLSGKFCQGSLQICKRNILVNDQSLNLMEGGGVSGIHLIGAEYTSGRDHPDGQFTLLHGPHLDRRGLASQEDIVVDIEGILLISGRMSLGDIQLFEVVLVVLHLRALDHLIAHSDEDALHLFSCNGVGMAVSHLVLFCRKGNIDDFFLQLLLSGFFRQCHPGLLQFALQLSPDIVDHLSYLGTVLRGHILHSF